MTTANEMQVAGTHYRTPYQHWDFVADAGLGYFEGQITKYLVRYKRKNGKQDVEKAMHFACKMAELFVVGKYRPPNMVQAKQEQVHISLNKFLHTEKGMSNDVRHAIVMSCVWSNRLHITQIISSIKQELAALEAAEPGPGYVNQDR